MTRKAMLADLKRSGLTTHDAKRARYKVLTRKQVEELTGNHAEGYLIPYHDLDGKKTDYWRVRYTEEVLGAFGAKPKKPKRYTGPKNELPRFYYPLGFDWKAAAKDPDIELVITEGEKKAEKGCKEGLPTISIPGVWAWRSKKEGIAEVKDFDLFEWKGRTVYLCFDNDVMEKPQVLQALNALSEVLANRGAVVVLKFLPKGQGKIALDDYLQRWGVEAWLKLKEEEYAKCGPLYQLNEQLAYVREIQKVYDFETRKFFKSESELKLAFSNRFYMQPTTDKNGEPALKKVKTIQAWLEWPQRREYKNVCYRPGEDDVVGDAVNLWLGWGCEADKGNVKPFLDLLGFIFDGEPELEKWFLQWLAYPLQNPGEKNITCVLLHSPAQGVGKSFIGYIMGEIYGPNFTVIDADAMQSPFNDWAVNKQFIMGEEVTGSNSRTHADRIKNMVTRERIRVNIKFQPGYDLDDCANLFFTSNHVDALFIEASDRRAVVHEIISQPKPREWYKRIDTWRKNGGPAHVFHYLINEVDLSDYDPKAPAPTTKAKEAMIALSKSDIDIACDVIKDNPDEILRSAGLLNESPLLTATQLQSFINTYVDSKHHVIAISKGLARAGFEMRGLHTPVGSQKLWCVRDREKWRKKADIEWGKEYAKHVKSKKF